MAQNWQNNGETVRLINDGTILSHVSADIKSGDLVLHGANNTAVVLKGVAMTDIVQAANVGELKYNVGSVCRIGEWLLDAILSVAAGQFKALHYNMTDKVLVDTVSGTKAAIAAILKLDGKTEPKKLVDASGDVTLATFALSGTFGAIGNEVFEITITQNSDLGATVPVNALFSIVGNNGNTTPVTGLETNTANADVFGVNSFALRINHTKDLYEGQKFFIATLGDNSGTNVVQNVGLVTESQIAGPHSVVPVSTVGKGLNQDEGPQGTVGKIPVLINF